MLSLAFSLATLLLRPVRHSLLRHMHSRGGGGCEPVLRNEEKAEVQPPSSARRCIRGHQLQPRIGKREIPGTPQVQQETTKLVSAPAFLPVQRSPCSPLTSVAIPVSPTGSAILLLLMGAGHVTPNMRLEGTSAARV